MTKRKAAINHHKLAKEYAKKHGVKYWYARIEVGTLKGKIKPNK